MVVAEDVPSTLLKRLENWTHQIMLENISHVSAKSLRACNDTSSRRIERHTYHTLCVILNDYSNNSTNDKQFKAQLFQSYILS